MVKKISETAPSSTLACSKYPSISNDCGSAQRNTPPFGLSTRTHHCQASPRCLEGGGIGSPALPKADRIHCDIRSACDGVLDFSKQIKQNGNPSANAFHPCRARALALALALVLFLARSLLIMSSTTSWSKRPKLTNQAQAADSVPLQLSLRTYRCHYWQARRGHPLSVGHDCAACVDTLATPNRTASVVKAVRSRRCGAVTTHPHGLSRSTYSVLRITLVQPSTRSSKFL